MALHPLLPQPQEERGFLPSWLRAALTPIFFPLVSQGPSVQGVVLMFPQPQTEGQTGICQSPFPPSTTIAFSTLRLGPHIPKAGDRQVTKTMQVRTRVIPMFSTPRSIAPQIF